jgi:hypothetical protein
MFVISFQASMSAEEIFEAKTALENVQCDLSTNTEICHLGKKFSSPANIFSLGSYLKITFKH